MKKIIVKSIDKIEGNPTKKGCPICRFISRRLTEEIKENHKKYHLK